MILVVCAWCGAVLGAKPGTGSISHGICPTCDDKLRDDEKTQQERERLAPLDPRD